MGTWTPGPGPTDGNDIFYGDDSAETADGGLGHDTLAGGGGDDTLFGGGGDDTLIGELGADQMFGGAGNDEIRIGQGNDTVDGGEGDDQISLFGGGTSSPTIAGGAGVDTLKLYEGTLGAGTTMTGVETLFLNGSFCYAPASIFNSISNLYGQGSTSTLYLIAPGVVDLTGVNVPATYELFPGGPLRQSSFNLQGSTGDDTIILPSNAGATVTLAGAEGNDTLTGGGGADRITGNWGNDVVNGGGGDDLVSWDHGGDDVMNGGDGNDLIWLSVEDGVTGMISMDGGAGYDTLGIGNATVITGNTFTNIEAIALLDGYGPGPGNGRLRYAPEFLSGAAVTFLSMGGSTLFPTASGVTNLTAMTMPATFVWGPATWNNQFHFQGTSGADSLLLPETGLAGVLGYGNDGADALTAGAASDWLNGGNGDDALSGGLGDDILGGDAGNDTLRGDEGFDTAYYYGVSSNYTITYGPNAITVFGPEGLDTLYDINRIRFADINIDVVAPGRTVNGTVDADDLSGGDGADTLNGADGDDTLRGRDNDDVLNGGNGGDVLVGGAGNDRLDGGDGNDVLRGGFGNDAMTGGLGDDYY